MKINTRINALLPNYQGIDGHEDIYHAIFQKIAEKAGFTYVILKEPFKASSKSFIKRFLEFAKIFPKKEEIFFCESFTAVEMIAYIIAALCVSKKSCHWLLFRDDLIHQRKKAYISLFFLNLLRFFKKKKFSLLSDSELVAKYFREKNFKVVLFPNPHAQELSLLPKSSPSLVCWWPGRPRQDKGAQIISYLLETHKSEITFMLDERFPISSTQLHVKRLASHLSREDYLAYLQMSDFILLPYDPIAYRVRSSGILVETVIAGKIPLVTEGTWLAHELKTFHLEELILDWKDPKFFDNLIMLKNSDETREKLQKMSEAYQKSHDIQQLANILTNLFRDY